MPGFQMEARVSIEGSEVWQHMGAENIGVGRGWSAHTQVLGAREGGGVGIYTSFTSLSSSREAYPMLI